MKTNDHLAPCGSSITIPGADGAVTYHCTSFNGHVRYRDSDEHAYAPSGEADKWQWWNDRGELTTHLHGWAEPSPERTYTVRMRQDDFQGLRDFLVGPHYVSSKQEEVLDRIRAALDAAESPPPGSREAV
jgi:hypothetical protein